MCPLETPNRSASSFCVTPFASLISITSATVSLADDERSPRVAVPFGAQGAAQGAEFPDTALLGYLSDTVDNMAVKLSGADASERYRIKAMASRAGTGTRLQDFVIGSVTQSINALGNLTSVADFTGLAPVAGEVEMAINRGAGNTTAVYLNGVILEANAA